MYLIISIASFSFEAIEKLLTLECCVANFIYLPGIHCEFHCITVGVSSGQALVSQQPTSATSAAQAAAIGSGIKRQRSPSPPRTCAAGQTISVGLPTRYEKQHLKHG